MVSKMIHCDEFDIEVTFEESILCISLAQGGKVQDDPS